MLRGEFASFSLSPVGERLLRRINILLVFSITFLRLHTSAIEGLEVGILGKRPCLCLDEEEPSLLMPAGALGTEMEDRLLARDLREAECSCSALR